MSNNPTQPPEQVVLVHGIFDTSRSLRKMARFLEDEGYGVYMHALRPRTGRRGIDGLAKQLEAAIRKRYSSDERFLLIGFSMGGLVCRYYVQRLGGIEQVRRLVTLSTPHHGSLLAYLHWNRGCRQMRPGSTFLFDLNRDVEMLDRVGVVSIWTPWDLSVIPPKSSILHVGRNVRVPVLLHPLMLRSRRTLEEIARALPGRDQTEKSTAGT